MAAGRLPKVGLDFFPLHVNIFSDDKIKFVGARFDEKGELIVVKLLQEIYKQKGYYMDWNEDEAALFAKAAGKTISPGLVKEVVNELLKREFLNEFLYTRFSILTSYNIQRTYEKICKDSGRKGPFIKTEHRITPWMLVQGEIPRQEIQIHAEEIDKTPPEIPQTKGKETKVKKTIPHSPPEMAVAWTDQVLIFKINILADEFLMETACMKAKIDSKDFQAMVEDFFRTKISTGEDADWKTEKDCRRNFVYWCPGYMDRKNMPAKNGKQEASTTYQAPAPRVFTDDRPLVDPKLVDLGFKTMIDEDLVKLETNPEFQPLLAAKKVDWLIKKKKLVIDKEKRDSYSQSAKDLFVQSLSDSMELIPSRATMDYYKSRRINFEEEPTIDVEISECFQEHDQLKIKVIAKELAYLDYLKSLTQKVEA